MELEQRQQDAVNSLLEGLEPHQIFAIVEKQRIARAAAQERALRPDEKPVISLAGKQQIKAHALRPLDAADKVNADLLCLEIIQAMKGGDLHEQHYQLIRLFRCVVAQQPHLAEEWQKAVAEVAR
jgi:hypothetical protein